MKKIYSLLTVTLLSLSLWAFDGSRISISSSLQKRVVNVKIDGQSIAMFENSIILDNVNQGFHQLIISTTSSRYGFVKRQSILFKNDFYLRNGVRLNILIDPSGEVSMHEIQYFPSAIYEMRETEEDLRYSNSFAGLMNNFEFTSLTSSLTNEWSEKNRLGSAKFVIDRNIFTVQQVNELMNLFSLDENKLEIAKYAYEKTVNQEKYFQLINALNFADNKEVLARFIRSCQ